MAEPIASLVVRILSDTSDMVTGVKKASSDLDGFENKVDNTSKTLVRHSEASTRAGASTGELTLAYRQFDGILQSVGINIGTYVKGLEDIIALGGKTTAVLAAVALATKAIVSYVEAQASANLQAETEAAKQDTINRAIANGAKATISYTEAVKFNIEVAKRNADAQIDWGLKLAAAQKEVRGLTDAQVAEIEIAKRAGATTEQLSNKYKISELALKELATRQREAAAATKQHEQAQKALAGDRKAAETPDLSFQRSTDLFENMDDRQGDQFLAAVSDVDAAFRGMVQTFEALNIETGPLKDTFAEIVKTMGQADASKFIQHLETAAGRVMQLHQEAERLMGIISPNSQKFGGDDVSAALFKLRDDPRNWINGNLTPLAMQQEQLLINNFNDGLVANKLQPQLAPPRNLPSLPSVAPFSTHAGFGAPNITINAQGSWWDSPDRINQLSRAVMDGIAKRSGLANTYTRR